MGDDSTQLGGREDVGGKKLPRRWERGGGWDVNGDESLVDGEVGAREREEKCQRPLRFDRAAHVENEACNLGGGQPPKKQRKTASISSLNRCAT